MLLEGWAEFFVAAAGAAAALAGLVVVAVSVNIERILKYDQLPSRAGAAVGQFVAALVVSLLCLAPQDLLALGIEVVAVGCCGWLLQSNAARIAIRSDRIHKRPAYESAIEVVRGQIQGLPFVVGGILLANGSPIGLNIVLFGIAAIFALSMYEAWILLVEILR